MTATPTQRRGPAVRAGRRLLGSSLVDTLVGPHGVDRYLELVRPNWTLNEPRGRIVRVKRMTPDSVTLTLRPNGAFAGFEPGQFVQVAVEIDGVRRTRCYSPAGSALAPDALELTVKTHPQGLVSRHLAQNAHAGMVVGLSAAEGDFRLPPARPERLLLISGGSGITPVLSMLRTLCAEGHLGRVDLVHYAPTREEALYRDELDAITARHANVRVLRSYTREPGAGELDGHFGATHLARIGDYQRSETFACGPPTMLDAIRASWSAAGLENRLHVESFVPPTLAIRTARSAASTTAGLGSVLTDSASQPEGTVSFARAGQAAPNDGRTLLEQAESASLSPEFGCRMGICHSCSCRKTAGTVRNAISGEVSSGEDEEIRICVSVPVGDVQLEL